MGHTLIALDLSKAFDRYVVMVRLSQKSFQESLNLIHANARSKSYAFVQKGVYSLYEITVAKC